MLIDINEKLLKKIHREYYSNLSYEHFVKRLKNKSENLSKTEVLNVEKQKASILQGLADTISKKSDNTEVILMFKDAINHLSNKEFKVEVNLPEKREIKGFEVEERDMKGDIKRIEVIYVN